MARQLINNTPADSGLGDTLFESMNKINAMTLELYAADSSFGDAIDLINSILLTINDGSSILNHKHTISQINGLQAALNSKVSTTTYINSMMAVTASIQAINDALNDIIVILNSKVEEAPFSGITYGRKDGNWVQITAGTTFTGGTVSGATNFTNGLTANTISATTYLGLPLDIRVTGGTYSNGTATFRNNTGGTFNVTGFATPFTGGTVNGLTATTISATTYLNLPTPDLSGYVPYVGATTDVQLGEFGLESSWGYGYARFAVPNGSTTQKQISFRQDGDGVNTSTSLTTRFNININDGFYFIQSDSSNPTSTFLQSDNGRFFVTTQNSDLSTSILAQDKSIVFDVNNGGINNNVEIAPDRTYSNKVFITDTGFERVNNDGIGQFYLKQEGAQYLGVRFESLGDIEGVDNAYFYANAEEGFTFQTNDNGTRSTEFKIKSGDINISAVSGPLVSNTQFTKDRTTFEKQIEVPKILFNSTGATSEVKALTWNEVDGTLDLGLKGGDVVLQIGQEQIIRVFNRTGINLHEIEYQAVRITGAEGNRVKVGLALGNSAATSRNTIGLVTEDIAIGQEGFITTSGLVRDIDTTGGLQGETWVEGDRLYLSPTIPGYLTNIKPVAPNNLVAMGYVVKRDALVGSIFVGIQNGLDLDDLNDVNILSATTGQVLSYTPGTNLWENKTIPTILGYTPLSPSSNIIPNVNNTLTVGSSTNQYANIFSNVFSSNGTGIVRSGTNLVFQVLGGTVEAARFDNNGNFGIGTSAPSTKLSILGVTQTGSSAVGIVDLAQTWNTTASPIAMKINITDTASNASSIIQDWQINGTSIFRISKTTIGVTSVGTYLGRGLNLTGGGASAISPVDVQSSTTVTSGESNIIFSRGGFNPTSGTGTHNSLTARPLINQTGGANGITRGLYVNPTLTAAFDFRAIEVTGGKLVYPFTITAPGTTGAQTINKISGKVNAAAASTSLVVTNSLVTTSSIVMCQLGTNDATCIIKSVVEANGSFTINYVAPTAETVIKFQVIN